MPRRRRRRRTPDRPESLLSAPDLDEADTVILPESGMVSTMITTAWPVELEQGRQLHVVGVLRRVDPQGPDAGRPDAPRAGRHSPLRPDLDLHSRRRHPHERRGRPDADLPLAGSGQRGHAVCAGLGRSVVQRLRVRADLRGAVDVRFRAGAVHYVNPAGWRGPLRQPRGLARSTTSTPRPGPVHHVNPAAWPGPPRQPRGLPFTRHPGERWSTPWRVASAPGPTTPRRSPPRARRRRSRRGARGSPGSHRSAAS